MTGRPDRILNVGVSAQLMLLDPGTFCIFHAPVARPPGMGGLGGLPGVRVTPSPTDPDGAITIRGLDDDGWLGLDRGAALVRVDNRPTWILVTTYHDPAHDDVRPNLQVARLYTPTTPAAAAAPFAAPATAMQQAAPRPATAPPIAAPQTGGRGIVAHIQRRGDVHVTCDEWMGTVGGHAWIEGFSILPDDPVTPGQIEYQAVLGQGWFSPWVEGGTYCGSRGMALPLLGLRVRLTGKAAEQFICRVSATFIDGSHIGPVEDIAVMSDDLSPLEAFRIEITPRTAQDDMTGGIMPENADMAADMAHDTQVLDLLDEVSAAQAAPAATRTRRGRRPARRDMAGEQAPSAIAAATAPRAGTTRGTKKSPAKVTAKTASRARTQAMDAQAVNTQAKDTQVRDTQVDATDIPPKDIHPGRGRKAPGSRVALLKARKKAATRRRT